MSDITSFEDVASTFEKVTGKKSRVKYLGSVDEFETFGEKGLEDVREMFRFLQHTGGKYFDGGVEIESETARALKAEAMRAVGGSEEEARLMSIKEFFEMHFGGEKK